MLGGLCTVSMAMRLRWGVDNTFDGIFIHWQTLQNSSYICGNQLQAFKLVVNDPDSILDSLTREVKETGPDGVEVHAILITSKSFIDLRVYINNRPFIIFSLLGDESGCCFDRGSQRFISKEHQKKNDSTTFEDPGRC